LGALEAKIKTASTRNLLGRKFASVWRKIV